MKIQENQTRIKENPWNADGNPITLELACKFVVRIMCSKPEGAKTGVQVRLPAHLQHRMPSAVENAANSVYCHPRHGICHMSSPKRIQSHVLSRRPGVCDI